MAYPPRHDRRQGGGSGGRHSRDTPRRSHRSHHETTSSELIERWRRIVLVRIVLVPPKDAPLDPALFDEIANETAKAIADEGQAGRNKSTQLRRFYDELLRWDEKVNGGGGEGAEERLREHLPFIRMMNAKAAYAKGRKLVGQSFVDMLRQCLGQVDEDPAALRNCRHFFEAFMGFYKLHSQD